MLVAPEYDHAYVDFLASAVEGLRRVDPLVGRVRRRVSRHHGLNRNVIGGSAHDSEGFDSEFVGIIDRDLLRSGNLDAHTAMVVGMASTHRDNLAKVMLSDLVRITDATGNTVDAGGVPLDLHHFIDLLERMPWKFDEQGNVVRNGEAFVVHPDMAERMGTLEETAEHRARLESIRSAKWEEWRATRRTRRLSRGSDA